MSWVAELAYTRVSLPTSGEDPKHGESARLPRPTRAGTQWPVGNGSTRAENGPCTTSEAPLCGISRQPVRHGELCGPLRGQCRRRSPRRASSYSYSTVSRPLVTRAIPLRHREVEGIHIMRDGRCNCILLLMFGVLLVIFRILSSCFKVRYPTRPPVRITRRSLVLVSFLSF